MCIQGVLFNVYEKTASGAVKCLGNGLDSIDAIELATKLFCEKSGVSDVFVVPVSGLLYRDFLQNSSVKNAKKSRSKTRQV